MKLSFGIVFALLAVLVVGANVGGVGQVKAQSNIIGHGMWGDAKPHGGGGGSCTGGSRSTSGGNTIITFTSSGSLVCSAGFTANEVLVVTGGGSGTVAGGGAGGVIDNTSVSVSSGTTTVTVAAGGAGTNQASDTPGNAGGNSVFGSLTAIGGAPHGEQSFHWLKRRPGHEAHRNHIARDYPLRRGRWRLGVLETRCPLSAVGLRRRFPENYEGVQCPNIEFATSRRMTTSPLRRLDLCAKMTTLRSGMLRVYATAIVASSGRGADYAIP
jgi:hypothetical protein